MAKELSTEEVFKKELSKQFYDVFRNVVVTEKATRMVEFENKLMFEVDKNATKPMMKLLLENEFKKPIKSINVIRTIKGKKRAIVRFKEEGVASEMASDLGIV